MLGGGPFMSVRQVTGRMTRGRRWEQIVLPLGLIVLGLALIITMQHLVGVILVLIGMLSARRVFRPRPRHVGRGGPAGPPSR
jgi:hypothetical protein